MRARNAPSDCYAYSVADPADHNLIDISGALNTPGGSRKKRTLQRLYDEWRKQFTLYTATDDAWPSVPLSRTSAPEHTDAK